MSSSPHPRNATSGGSPHHLAERVIAASRRLRETPRPPGCRLLRDYDPPTWRVRVRNSRILYEIDDEAGVVIITAVRHRSKAY